MVVFLSSRMVFQKPSISPAQPVATALSNPKRQVPAKNADKTKSAEQEGHSITLLEGLAIGAAVLFVFSLFTDSDSGGDSSYSHDDDDDVEGNLRTWKQREENYERERQTESRNNAEYMMEQKRQQDNLYYEQRKQEQGY
jgi:hypothetical protein